MATDRIWFDEINAYVEAVYKKESEIIEEACEKSLCRSCGVLVVRDLDGRLLGAEVDSSVPYGHIYEVNVPRPNKEESNGS